MLKRAICTALLLSVSSTLFAKDITGTITSIKVPKKKPVVLFELIREAQDACATTGWFVINTSKPGGDNQYQLLLSAYNSGKEVTVTTKNSQSCTDEAGVSSAQYISLGQPKVKRRKALPGMGKNNSNK